MMMKYKVGDEVLVKGNFSGISKNGNCIIKTDEFEFFTEKDKVIPVPDMTTEEAWEIAKKLFADYSNAELDEIFGKGWSFPKLMEMTPHEAKSKIKAWEAEKEIKAGDEVEFDGEIGVVTKTDGAEGFYSLLFKNGETGAYQAKRIKKTGRHIDIDGLLKQIGGNE